MQQVNFETFFEPSVAEDPSGATDFTTQWNKNQNLLYCNIQIRKQVFQHGLSNCNWGTSLSNPHSLITNG